MEYPFLPTEVIDGRATVLRERALGMAAREQAYVDLETLVYDHLCEQEAMSFTDEAELGWEDGEQVLGKTWPIAGKIEIDRCLKRPGEEGRYRFTLAHEIGHWVLHRPLFIAPMTNLDLFGERRRPEALTSLNRGVFPDGGRRPVPPEEWQANRFAVALLFNPELLRRECHCRFGEEPVARQSPRHRLRTQSLRELSRRLGAAEVNGHPPLCAVFGVSAEAMAIALETRGYVVERPPVV